MDGNVSLCVTQSTALVKAEISKQLLNRLPWNLDIHGLQRMKLTDNNNSLTNISAQSEM